MIRRHFNILLVDDEPDVLAISKLAMRSFEVYDLPIHIYTANSKAEAIELINSTLMPSQMPGHNFAVAFIDVVMESDTAGLELCHHIRQTLKNREVQLYIRTGQPGIAPERDVLDRYDINGYFTKAEATEDKLYSLVKSGVRANYLISSATVLNQMTHAMIAASHSRNAMSYALLHVREYLSFEEGMKSGFIFTDRIHCANCTIQEIATLRDELDVLDSIALNTEGDKYVVDSNRLLIKVAESLTTAELYLILETFAPPPEFFVILFYQMLKSMSMLWKKAS